MYASPAMRFAKVLFIFLLFLTLNGCKVIRDLTTERPRGVDSAEISLRRRITDYARRFEGSRYLYAGKRPSTGFDCSGFTSFVMSEYGITLSPSSRDQALQGKEVRIDKALPGDLIFFRRSSSEPIFHVSLVLENDGKSLWVIHSTTSRGVIIEDLLASSYWKPKIFSARDVISTKGG